jgi:hypothetical protein
MVNNFCVLSALFVWAIAGIIKTSNTGKMENLFAAM